MAPVYVNAELLLGREVRDVDGRAIGRIEEFRCGKLDGHDVVLEYHLGAGGALERVLAFVRALPFFGMIPAPRMVRVPWGQMDLSDPARPRVRVRREELAMDAPE